MVEFAKYQFDVGLRTNDRDAMLAFWQNDVGLNYDGKLGIGGGTQQHRHSHGGSILKLNHSRDEIADAPPAGYAKLLIAKPGLEVPKDLADPDGNIVTLLPPGTGGITQWGLEVSVSDLAEHKAFWGEVIGLPAAPRAGSNAFQLGDSVLILKEDPSFKAGGFDGKGFRYITLQVWDADKAHKEIVAKGGHEAALPMTHGQVARYSFVTDPDGNWIELSQRASLTGPVT